MSKYLIIDSTFEFEYALSSAEKQVKPIVHDMICPVHQRRVSLSSYYDNNGIYADITSYCCLEFANHMANVFEETDIFDHVTVK